MWKVRDLVGDKEKEVSNDLVAGEKEELDVD